MRGSRVVAAVKTHAKRHWKPYTAVTGVAAGVLTFSVFTSSNNTQIPPGGSNGNDTMATFSKNASAGCSTANIWVNTSAGGSPSRSGTLVAYNATNAYGTIESALSAASGGDLICVQSGTYDSGANMTLTSNFGSQVTVRAKSPLGVYLGTSVQGDTSGVGAIVTGGSGDGTHVTFDGINIPGGIDGTADATVITGLHFTNDAICVGAWQNSQCINFHNTNDLEFIGDTIGPICCGNNPSGGSAHNSPELIRLGIPGPSGGQSFTNTFIENSLFQGAERSCTYWPTNYYYNGSSISAGSCPDSTCTNFSTCHVDQIHIWGIQSSTIANNWFWNTDCQAISLTGSNGSTNSNVNIYNNMVDQPVESCGSPSIAFQDCGGGAAGDGFAGTFNVEFNSVVGYISYDANVMDNCDASGTVWNYVGNVGAYYNPSDSGCGTGSTSTINFAYNYWSTAASGINCAGTGGQTTTTAPSSFAFWIDTNGAQDSFDLHLTGASPPPVGMVPSSYCNGTNPSGSLNMTTNGDLDGNSRTAPCDAGADQG